MTNNENLREVYEQYWLHGRHVENERLWFTNIYALIMAGVFAVEGLLQLPSEIKFGLFLFVFILSLVGFCMIYVLRVPFLKFVLMSELIAIKEFNLRENYWRFFRRKEDGQIEVFPRFKLIDMPELFEVFYSCMGGITFYFAFSSIWNIAWWTGLIISVVLLCIYLFWLKSLLLKVSDEFKKSFEELVN